MKLLFEILQQIPETPEKAEKEKFIENEIGDLKWEFYDGNWEWLEMTPDQKHMANALEAMKIKQAVLLRSLDILDLAITKIIDDRLTALQYIPTSKWRKDGWSKAKEDSERLIKDERNILIVLKDQRSNVMHWVQIDWKTSMGLIKDIQGFPIDVGFNLNPDPKDPLKSAKKWWNHTEKIDFLVKVINSNRSTEKLENYRWSTYAMSFYQLRDAFQKLLNFSYPISENFDIDNYKDSIFKLEWELYKIAYPKLVNTYSGDVENYKLFSRNIIDWVFENNSLLRRYSWEGWLYDSTELYNNNSVSIPIIFNDKWTQTPLQVNYIEISWIQKTLDSGQAKLYLTWITEEGLKFKNNVEVKNKVWIKYEVTVTWEQWSRTITLTPVKPRWNGYFVQSQQVDVYDKLDCNCSVILQEKDFKLVQWSWEVVDELNKKILQSILVGSEPKVSEKKDISYGVITKALYNYIQDWIVNPDQLQRWLLIDEFLNEYGSGNTLTHQDIMKRINNFLMEAIRNDPQGLNEIRKLTWFDLYWSFELPFWDNISYYIADQLIKEQKEFSAYYWFYTEIKNKLNDDSQVLEASKNAKKWFRADSLHERKNANKLDDNKFEDVVNKLSEFDSFADVNYGFCSWVWVNPEWLQWYINKLWEDSDVASQYELFSNPVVRNSSWNIIKFKDNPEGYRSALKDSYSQEQAELFWRYFKKSCVLWLMEGMSVLTTGHEREKKWDERWFSYDAEPWSLAYSDPSVAALTDMEWIGPADKSVQTEASNWQIGKQIALDIMLIAISGWVAWAVTRLAIRGMATAAMTLAWTEETVLFWRWVYQTVRQYKSIWVLSTEWLSGWLRTAYWWTRVWARVLEWSLFLVNNTLLNATFQQDKILASGMWVSDYIYNTLGDPWKYIESIVTLSVVWRVQRFMHGLRWSEQIYKELLVRWLEIPAEMIWLMWSWVILKVSENVLHGKNLSDWALDIFKPENIWHLFATIIWLRIAYAVIPKANPFENVEPVIEITSTKPLRVRFISSEGKSKSLDDVIKEWNTKPNKKTRRWKKKKKIEEPEKETKNENEHPEEVYDYRNNPKDPDKKLEWKEFENRRNRYALFEKLYNLKNLVYTIWKNYKQIEWDRMAMAIWDSWWYICWHERTDPQGNKTTITDAQAYNSFANFLARMGIWDSVVIQIYGVTNTLTWKMDGSAVWKITRTDLWYNVEVLSTPIISDRGMTTWWGTKTDNLNSAARWGNGIAPTVWKTASDSDILWFLLWNEIPKEDIVKFKEGEALRKTQALKTECRDVLKESNIETYTEWQLVEKYQNNQVEIQCVDGRSKKRNDKLVIHVPWWEFWLYSKLLKALWDLWLSAAQSEKVFRKFMSNGRWDNGSGTPRSESTYAHSDDHGNRPGETDSHHPNYFYGKETNPEHFRCGCGHCNLFMSSPAVQKTTAIVDGKEVWYDIDTAQKKLLNEYYPSEWNNLDILTGNHVEQWIVVQNRNSDGSMSSLQSNRSTDGKQQVFSYDVEAVKSLIDHISIEVSQIMKSECGVSKKPSDIAAARKWVLDTHTTLTVFHLLWFAQRLATAWDLYHLKTTDGGKKMELRRN